MNFTEIIFSKRLHWLLFTYIIAFGGVYWFVYLMPIGLMAFLCRFDSIGYGEILGDKKDGSPPLRFYRMQDGEISAITLILSVVVIKLLGFTWWDGLTSFFVFFIIYWFGGKDLLFYWAREEYLEDYVNRYDDKGDLITIERNEWSWMYFTPLGIIEILKQKKNLIKVWKHEDKVMIWLRDLKIQAWVGVLLSLAILTIWYLNNIIRIF